MRRSFSKSLRCQASGFTLVELLVVIGIIAILLAILIPVVSAATRNARAVQCQSNVRQIEIELFNYASQFQGKFPPNLSSPNTGFTWTDSDKIGRLTPKQTDLRGPIATCPDDPGALRSYAMNVWASSKIDQATLKANKDQPWHMGAKQGDQLILVTEKWSLGTPGSYVVSTPAIVGAIPATPAERFGGDGGLNPLLPMGKFGNVCSELPFQRHRSAHANFGTQPIGQISIGFLDGHVSMLANDQLVNESTGLSTLIAMWSPMDPQLNH